MSRYKYIFINDNNFYYTGNKLKNNPRIVKIDPYLFPLNDLKYPNPSYETVDELISKDKPYKDFKKVRQEAARLIALEENIQFMKGMVLAHERDNDQAGNMLIHLIEGSRKSKTFSGVHYLPAELPPDITNFKIIEPPNEIGVYTASFDIIDRRKKTLTKKEVTTLFPNDWTLQTLYDECLYALNHKKLINEETRLFKSTTHCGIPVELYFDQTGRRIHTLYPIR